MGLISSGQIEVKNLHISLKKGLYPLESLIENQFLVSSVVFYDPDQLKTGHYLNYEQLTDILFEEMNKDINLLETIASNILKRILDTWPLASRATVRIEKLNPGFISRQIDSVVVALEISRT